MIIERADPTDRAVVEDVAGLLLLGVGEVLAPIQPLDAMADLYTVMTEGMTFVAKNDEGRIVGVLALERRPYRLNRAVTILVNAHFFIHPEWRGKGIAEALRNEAKAEGEDLGAIVLLAEFNGRKAARYRSVTMGFVPTAIETQLR